MRTTAEAVREEGRIVKVIGNVMDITERKRAGDLIEAARTRSEEQKAKTEAILAAIGDGISIQDMQFRVLCQNEVMTGLVKLIRKVTRADIEIKTIPAEGPVMIRADRGQVEQVAMNLCLNARDAMPEGGQLAVETAVISLEEGYLKQYPYMKAGRYAVLSVSDTGMGMDEETRERIFEPFFTTKGPDTGTGLGLAVVYGIVKQHNGFIHVYSEPGRGSTFRVYFPEVNAAAAARVVESRGAARGGNETILLAEENESVAMVVLDVVMPKKGGKQAYDEMIAAIPGMKVLFLSGYSANAIHDSFFLHPGISFLQKPFGPGALARKVREVLDGK